MHSNRGFTLIELLVVVALIAILSAVAIPTLSESTSRQAVWSSSEQIGAQIRQARLKAITRNTPFRIVFACPAANQYRVLIVDGTIDDEDRCSQTVDGDSGVTAMPANVTFGDPPTLEVNGRGMFSLPDGGLITLPLDITVQYGDTTHARTMTVSATGQITFETF